MYVPTSYPCLYILFCTFILVYYPKARCGLGMNITSSHFDKLVFYIRQYYHHHRQHAGGYEVLLRMQAYIVHEVGHGLSCVCACWGWIRI